MSAPEPEKLRRLAEEWLNGPDYMTPMYYQSVSLARLLERVVRECAEEAFDSGFGKESKVKVLRAFGLAPSPESKKENR